MKKKNSIHFTPVVITLRIILYTFFIVYSLAFLTTIFILVTSIISHKMGVPQTDTWVWIRFFIENGLCAPIYCFIAYCLFKLTYLIAHREPFSPTSPRYIRKIAYSVFFLFFVDAILSAIREFTAPALVVSEALIRFFFPGGMVALLLGFGFLVIAGVLEVGVKLQQEQNLTV